MSDHEIRSEPDLDDWNESPEPRICAYQIFSNLNDQIHPVHFQERPWYSSYHYDYYQVITWRYAITTRISAGSQNIVLPAFIHLYLRRPLYQGCSVSSLPFARSEIQKTIETAADTLV